MSPPLPPHRRRRRRRLPPLPLLVSLKYMKELSVNIQNASGAAETGSCGAQTGSSLLDLIDLGFHRVGC